MVRDLPGSTSLVSFPFLSHHRWASLPRHARMAITSPGAIIPDTHLLCVPQTSRRRDQSVVTCPRLDAVILGFTTRAYTAYHFQVIMTIRPSVKPGRSSPPALTTPSGLHRFRRRPNQWDTQKIHTKAPWALEYIGAQSSVLSTLYCPVRSNGQWLRHDA